MNTKALTSSKWIAAVGIVSSILTIAQAILYFFLIGKETSPQWLFVIMVIALILCVFSLCFLLVNSQLKNAKLEGFIKYVEGKNKTFVIDVKKCNSIISKLSKYNHSINHQLRQTLDELYTALFFDDEEEEDKSPQVALDESSTPDVVEEIQEVIAHANILAIRNKFRAFLQHFTSQAKASFDTLTGDDSCSVYITLIETGDNDKYIASTYYRDPISYTDRTHIDAVKNPFGVELFTPFKQFFSGSNVKNFACDNCKSYANFVDVCDDWNDYYNACVTVPIRVRKEKNNNVHKLLGFITVDNLKGGLDNIDAKNLLSSYADLLYTPLNMYIDLAGPMR